MDALYVGLILLFAILSMIGLTVCVKRLGHKCWPILRNCKAIIVSQRQQQSHSDTKPEKLNGSASKNPFSSMLHRSSITPTRQNVTKVDIHVESASDKANLSELLKPASASFDSSERRASREDKICLLIKRASELQLQATSTDSTSAKETASASEAASIGKGGKKQTTLGSPVGAECSVALATAETSCDETDEEQTEALVRMRPNGDVLLQMNASTGAVPQKEAAVLPESEKDAAGAHKQRLPALFASPFTRRRNRPSFTFAYSQDFADNGVDEDRLMLQICPASVPDAPGSSKAPETLARVAVADACGSPALRQQQQSNSLEEKSDRLMPLHPFHRQKQLEVDETARENTHKPPDSRRELRERKLQRFIKSMDIDSDSDSACSSKVSTASSRPRLQHELSIPTDSGVSCTMSSNVPHPHAPLGTCTSTLSVQRPANDAHARPVERRQKRLTFAHNRSQSNYESGELADATAKNQSNVVIQIRQLTEEDDAEKNAPARPRQTLPKAAISKQRSVDNSHLPPADSVPKTRRTPNESATPADPTSPARSSSSFCTPDHSDEQSDDCADAHARAIQSRADELLRALTQTVLLGGISRSQQGLNAQPNDRGVLLDPASLLHHASTLGSLSNSTRCCACQCHHHAPTPGPLDPHSLLLVQTVLPLVLRNSLSSLRKKKRRRSRTRQHSRSSNALHADSHPERSSLRTFDDEQPPTSLCAARTSDCAERHADTSKDDSSNTSGCHGHHTRSRTTPRSVCPPTDLRKTHRHRTSTADGVKPRSSVSSATDDSSLHGRAGALIGHKIWHHDDDQDAFDPCV